MNALAGANVPFLFIVDYAQEQSHIEPLDRIDPATCLFQFPEGRQHGDGCNSPCQKHSRPMRRPYPVGHHSPLPRRIQTFVRPREAKPAGRQQLPDEPHLPGTRHHQSDTGRNIPPLRSLVQAVAERPVRLLLPEIFVRIEKGKIKSFPMKGTIDATLPDAEQLLMQDTKEAAEHATIVDLIRNDLSMVSEHVEVTSYRYIDRLQTNKGPILQTSSEICGTLPEDYTAHLGDIIFRLLPAGSITGAPKPKTVEIIAQAEDYRRGFYTGIMGHYADGQLDSAVMIRFIEQENGQLHFKAGGGITAKSRWESEYNEVIQKIYVPIY